ncbi:hypothetical protein [Pelomicrobium methylotrophicum]|uniref:Uncharacterized protein n=1 Tax=Pelomicrobium methylotrophicum TaxID=2602750 RepID=A0A5C7EYT4_9PROT|nr:hypothetical protein [Pelomicrobium methylotrophicum]TXF12252.1 hypothetical protein FR698_06890 [Pelomicrobium methylotrophicum]
MQGIRKFTLLSSALALAAGLGLPAAAQAGDDGDEGHAVHAYDHKHHRKHHHPPYGWVPPGHRYYHYHPYAPPSVIYRSYKEYHYYDYPRYHDRHGGDFTIIWRGSF